MLSGVLCRFQNVVWRVLLQNIFQFLVQFLSLVVFLVQFEAESGIQCNPKFAFGICGRIESILKFVQLCRHQLNLLIILIGNKKTASVIAGR